MLKLCGGNEKHIAFCPDESHQLMCQSKMCQNVALKKNIVVENLESTYICMHKTLQNISDMSDINRQ